MSNFVLEQLSKSLAANGRLTRREAMALNDELQAAEATETTVGQIEIPTVEGVYRPLLWEENAQTESYALVLTDAGKVVSVSVETDANTLTIPAEASVDFDVGTMIYALMLNTGVTTITGDTGVSVNGVSAGTIALTQYGMALLYKRGADDWIVNLMVPTALT